MSYTLSLVIGTLMHGQIPAMVDTNTFVIGQTETNTAMVNLLENRRWITKLADGTYIVNADQLAQNINSSRSVDMELVNSVPTGGPTTSWDTGTK